VEALRALGSKQQHHITARDETRWERDERGGGVCSMPPLCQRQPLGREPCALKLTNYAGPLCTRAWAVRRGASATAQ